MSKAIDGAIVKKLRKQRGFSQSTLADKTGLAKDSISRLERGKQTGKARQTGIKIAAAFGVSREVLTGEAALSDDTISSLTKQRRPIGISVDGSVRNAYDLVALRYQIPRARILELAPFLFVLAAERSLSRRRERLAALEEALGRADDAAADFHHLPQSIAPSFEATDAIAAEAASIANRDILAAHLDGDLFRRFGPLKDGYNDEIDNPFVRLLKDEVQDPNAANISLFSRDEVAFEVCRLEALQIAGGDLTGCGNSQPYS